MLKERKRKVDKNWKKELEKENWARERIEKMRESVKREMGKRELGKKRKLGKR